MGRVDASKSTALEKPAYSFGGGVNSFLSDNPEIFDKLREGKQLSQEELGKVSNAFQGALKSAGLKPGLQFVEGTLLFVQVPE